MNKAQLIQKIMSDFSYTKKELEEWQFICIEEDKGMFGNIFFDGNYVLFAEDKVIWY